MGVKLKDLLVKETLLFLVEIPGTASLYGTKNCFWFLFCFADPTLFSFSIQQLWF